MRSIQVSARGFEQVKVIFRRNMASLIGSHAILDRPIKIKTQNVRNVDLVRINLSSNTAVRIQAC